MSSSRSTDASAPRRAAAPLLKRGKPLLSFVVILLIWQAVAMSGRIPRDYFPDVPQIAQALQAELGSRTFWWHEANTLLRATGGLLASTFSGLALALLAARYRVVERALAPLVQIMLSLPPVALVPLSIFVLGLGAQLFAFIIWFAGVWCVYISAINALRASEPVQSHVARTLGYTPWQILRHVRLPAAWPEIFTGIRLAVAACLVATVATEMLAGQTGLGFLLYDAAFSLRIPDMFAALVVAGLNGVLLNQAVAFVRRQVVGWHDALAALAAV